MTDGSAWIGATDKSEIADRVAAARAAVLRTRADLSPSEVMAALDLSPQTGSGSINAVTSVAQLELARVVVDASEKIRASLPVIGSLVTPQQIDAVRAAMDGIEGLVDAAVREATRTAVRVDVLERRLAALTPLSPPSGQDDTAVGRLASACLPGQLKGHQVVSTGIQRNLIENLGVIRSNALAMRSAFDSARADLMPLISERASALMLALSRDVPDLRARLAEARVPQEETYEPQWSLFAITQNSSGGDDTFGDLLDLIQEVTSPERRARLDEPGVLGAVVGEAKVLSTSWQAFANAANAHVTATYPVALLRSHNVLLGIRKVESSLSMLANMTTP